VNYLSLHFSSGQSAVKLSGAEASLTKNPMTKAKGYILLKKGKRKKQKALSFLHKGIINTNSFTLELVIN